MAHSLPRLQQRSAGILLHLSSLPGPGSIGNLGKSAHDFVEQLAAAGQRWWQMLPTGPVGEGFSPYSSPSSFAGEPLFLDLQDLVEMDLLTRGEARLRRPNQLNKVAYPTAKREHLLRLKMAYSRAGKVMGSSALVNFRKREKHWLEDFVLFSVMTRKFKTNYWWKWPKAFASRDRHTLAGFAREHHEAIEFEIFCQYLFDKQWRSLRRHCKEHGVALIGDIPIFVAAGSSDTWANPDSFLLKSSGAPAFVAGCPPDDFNRNGQLWGNALYDWSYLKKHRYRFWMDRLQRVFELFDVCRLDHFIGFKRYWRIPAGAKTAKGGKWIAAPGDHFFKQVTRRFDQGRFIAEDLGSVSPAVRKLRDDYHFPGMKLIQFSFGDDPEAEHHQPFYYPANAVVYTGTHDNNTTKGWLADLKKSSKGPAKRAISAIPPGCDPVWAFNSQALMSPANLCILPMQDVLGMDSKHRMNTPGTTGSKNWTWRLTPGEFNKAAREKLHQATFGSRRI